jgi:hypothetical protein
MSKVMLFKRGLHAKDLDMRYLDDVEQKNHCERFKAAGYYENPPIVTMYNPKTREQLTIHAEDQSILESRGFFLTPTWVYHPEEAQKGKIVSKEEADQLIQNGWYDNPGKFPGGPLGIAKAKSTLVLPKGAAA